MASNQTVPDTTADLLDVCADPILQLKIHLLDISPMIWRRVLVPAAATLENLHGILQVVMGWEGIHLYQFRIHALHYGSWNLGAKPANRTLDSFNFRDADKFVYVYDMTSDWKHEVRVEAWRERQSGKHYPACIGGHGACPPEDCGGPRGYDERKTEVLSLESIEDLDTMAEFVDRIVLQKQPELLNDPDIRDQFEAVVERLQSRVPFLSDTRFDRRNANARLRAGVQFSMSSSTSVFDGPLLTIRRGVGSEHGLEPRITAKRFCRHNETRGGRL